MSKEIGTCDYKLEKFQSEIGNTSYILPQIEKDKDRETYFKSIYDSLYHGFNNIMVDIKENPNLENETIYQIANILCVQTLMGNKQEILTFNYDNYLEKVLDRNFPQVVVESTYKNRKTKNNAEITIVHSHGFMPLEDYDEVHKNSIILSSFEYMDAYKDGRSYSYKRLYEQLHKTRYLFSIGIIPLLFNDALGISKFLKDRITPLV